MLIHLVNDGRFSWIFMILVARVCILILMMEACLGCVAMSCRVFWSTVRSFFTALLLFERLVILLLANSTTSRGQESWCWVGASLACLMAEELLHFTCAAQPNFLYYSSVIAFSIRQQISFKNDPMLVLLLDSSRKINHLCNLFNDLTWTQKKFNSQHIFTEAFLARNENT